MKGLTLDQKEQARLCMLNKVLEGQYSVAEVAELMGVSERHEWRLLAAYREEGAAALAHGNRGRRPVHAIPEETRIRVLELAEKQYDGFNHCHFTELLAQREGLCLSRSTVRRILVEAGINSPRQRRAPQSRYIGTGGNATLRRECPDTSGIDGSPDASGLEGRGPYLTLVGAIDDATGTVPYALFREQEDAQGYFILLSEIIRSQGVPLAVYSDRHSIFQRSPKEPESLEEQLEGKRQPTQFGRALKELGIQAIFALSPQAKGRIESRCIGMGHFARQVG